MAGIPGTLLFSLKRVLEDCDDVFLYPDELRTIFLDERLRLWRAGLPEASSLDRRVSLVIGYLAEKYRANGENALVILLTILTERYPPDDDRHERLRTLAGQFAWLNRLRSITAEATNLEANPISAQMLPVADAEKMLACARSVARIDLRRSRKGVLEGRTTGTGWLITPTLAITCWHVIEAAKASPLELDPPLELSDLQAQLATTLFTFDYTTVARGIQYGVDRLLYPSIDTKKLDFALIRLRDREDHPLASRGYLRLDIHVPLTVQTALYIIQHPLGQEQQMSVDTFERLSPLPGRILYRTPTEPGTSGAPVFNRFNWRVVALHNGENKAAHLREGTLLEPILSELRERKPDLYDEIMAAQNAKE
ncbi:MAG TPA: serine protease [Ktedonobacteraceae bacterium]|nr:serine protease [Ktedonobacteraceae bacterium]